MMACDVSPVAMFLFLMSSSTYFVHQVAGLSSHNISICMIKILEPYKEREPYQQYQYTSMLVLLVHSGVLLKWVWSQISTFFLGESEIC